MSKSKLKRLLEWCPRPEKPLTTTLKRYSIPTTILISISLVLASFFLLFPSAPTQPTLLPPPPPTVTGEYNPGVSVGDYVTYGNFVCKLYHPDEGTVCIKDLAFWKVEIVEVKGKEVTFLQTQQYKNGAATPYNGCRVTWDVEQFSWSLDTENWIDDGFIIAANLTEGHPIARACSRAEHMLTKTEVRTYLGVSRNVNLYIISPQTYDWLYSNTGEENPINVTRTWVYDLDSGFLLECETSTLDGSVIKAMSIIETNIFSSPISARAHIPMEALYATTGLFVIVIFVITMVIFRKRRLKGGENNKE